MKWKQHAKYIAMNIFVAIGMVCLLFSMGCSVRDVIVVVSTTLVAGFFFAGILTFIGRGLF